MSLSMLKDVKIFLLFVLAILLSVTNNNNEEDVEDVGEKSDLSSYQPKLWFLKEVGDVFGVAYVPLSPLSLLCIVVVSINLVLNWGTYAWCEASHILIKDHSEKAKIALRELREEIGTDYNKFAAAAKEHSQCPSSRQGGSLGRFYRGDMAKNFDRACFDPKLPTGKAIGPVETSFGIHLIFIQNRSI